MSIGGLVIGTVALSAVLLASWRVIRRLRRKRDTDQPPQVVERPVGGLGTRLAALAVALLIVAATGGAVVLGARIGGAGRGSRPPLPVSPSPVHTRAPASHGGQSGPGPLWLLMTGLALVVVVAVLVALARARTASRSRAAPAPTAAARPPARPAGRPTLGADSRSVVIATYLAMERELARVRLRREPFETPAELLQRAAREGLDTSAAQRLAALFGLARYSSRPVSADQREQAEQFLEIVREQWMNGPRTQSGSRPRGGES
ncbi:DUF4129 domain-containing protein [Streptomyces sp. NPDC047028]|uniref:DUF4129 domain-containing protein n=1 Tax=Streptomyces sp. NPDC047028 TaxID=3155793 RepID=UPI0033DC43EC